MFKIITKCKDLLILGRYNNPSGAFLLMCHVIGERYQILVKENLFSSLFLFGLGSFVMRQVAVSMIF